MKKNGSVTRYVYSATGEKLRVIHQTAVPNITVPIGGTRELSPSEILSADTTDYLLGGSLTLRNHLIKPNEQSRTCSSFAMAENGRMKSNGRIDKLQFEEGYCQAEQYAYDANRDKITFYYYDRDHLGNVRQVITATGTNKGTVVQRMDYYPFGAQLCGGTYDSNFQSHKYNFSIEREKRKLACSSEREKNRPKVNGKEFDKMHGLNTYDYGARQYNPILGRWDRMDPLCEKYYDVSPYAYCHNNPVNAFDPNGEYDLIGIYSFQYYPVIAVFPYNDIHDEGAIEFDYNAALNSGVPIILVENINDFADAMSHLQEMFSYTNSYTLNSHGLLGNEEFPTYFKIGDDIVDADTDLSLLRNGLENHTVFIGACNVGKIEGRGWEMITSIAEQTNSIVIAPDHPVKAGYVYDGSNYLYNADFHPPMLPMDNTFVISHKGDLQFITNVTIDKIKGFSWDFNVSCPIPGFLY